MKLSEMNTKQLAKALCDLTQPVANICGDKDVMDAMTVLKDVHSGAARINLADVIAKVAPVLLDKHYDDVMMILSALTGKEKTEIDQQTGMQTMTDIMTCMDGDLATFFTSSAPMAQTPSSAQSMPTERRRQFPRFLDIWRKKLKKTSG